ncbi:hypothetical protein HYPSUDRAFT_205001 [Hypholoma sublateritium FD-334 SS-4]|uniref:Uncharacterized protein n=1 Tax=Hypholoma sublateritium (strain FD-334 SS-4) TaxID=945553 RepID=A0A0D2M6S8_HYPSF|nr:hypothetical protein HYPSUDRAFT_205001 [Hypholoma sublateritium FD-334 SS-4]
MSQPSHASNFQLDPGVPRRKSRLAVHSVLKALFVLGCLWAVYVVASAVYAGVRSRNAPHPTLYQDMDVPYKPSDVVRPLLDAKQTFSVVATVWARDPEFGGEDVSSVGSADAKAQGDLVQGGPVLHERAIFSDTIFRDLRLESETRDIQTAVKLKIPTSIFLNSKLWNYDLRASFVLIPDTPSPLDHAVNYSSWIPSGVNFPSVRPWTDSHLPSIQDQIVDSYGVFIPLLAFMPINSTCPKPSIAIKSAQQMIPAPQDSDSEDDMDDMDIPALSHPEHARTNFIKSYASTDSHSVLDAHPYIVTRSHVRVVDMVRLYNRTAYVKHHHELQSNSCGGRLVDNTLSDWRLCHKDFSTNGNGETRVKLRKFDPNSQQMHVEWAYGPYLSLFESAWGPLDLVKVPVKREQCDEAKSPSPNISAIHEGKAEDTYMNVQWNVVFSIVSPGQLFLADSMALAVSVYNMKHTLETEAERQKVQSRVEYLNALGGHKFNEDSHPRLHSTLYVLCITTSIISGIFAFHYWLTRTSTVGISIQGSALIAVASLLHIQSSGSGDLKKKQSVSEWLFVLLVGKLPLALTDIFILKAILRVELGWHKRWIPILRILPATHLERASSRIEARIPWIYKALAFAVLSTAFSYNQILSLFSLTPFDAQETLVTSVFSFPALVLGPALQILFNSRSKTFAGLYRPNAPLLLLETLFGAAKALPIIVGNIPSAKGMSLFGTTKLMLHLVLTYQAAVYSPVNDLEEEDQSTL